MVERLFSVVKKVASSDRPNLNPYHFEMQLFLHINRNIWDEKLVGKIIINEEREICN